ncbi:glutamate transport system ATP-binding protein [Salinisphaera shabanensis E1L3A]|uniref:Glutamate transport system ATP-binding protein n=1 Tax=Salinisphaera shabanensis E1L3A TaxID=1033802 RepID=F7Q8S0_9GAMM|nr:amino acid ABC transporter permease/ATP-binding protein [Salinisphaera shabanensis]ERJ20110.1 glutamate transport system ATP-binding protein [Salinisphaera shabanensis E1L3A]
MDASAFLHYLTLPLLWEGLKTAMIIAVLAFAAALPFSLGMAMMRMSHYRIVRLLPIPFIWVMRGTPILLQLLFWYNVLPLVGLGLSAFWTAVLGLMLNEIAFMSEIIRGGLQSIKKTQRDAASALGLSSWQIMHRVIMPQAMRSIAPAMANEGMVIVKHTSLASVITVQELTLSSEQVVSTNFQYVEVFLAAGVLYLGATTLIALAQNYLERHLDLERRGHAIAIAAQAGRERGENPLTGETAPAGAESGGKTIDTEAPALQKFLNPGRALANKDGRRADGPRRPYVVINKVAKSFHGKRVLRDVSFNIFPGEVVFLIGPSGSGKTTLLRTINRLETVDDGEITVGGQFVGYRASAGRPVPLRDAARSRARVGVGMVFQHFNLFDHLTVLENVIEAPVRVHGTKRDQARAEARELLAWAGLAEYENHYPHQLSGGQQQRIAIIRAVATRPKLLLFDEPTSALDPELVNEVLDLMRKLAESGMTMVVVSHEIVFARDWADKVVFMEDGEIVQHGAPEEVFNSPDNPRTKNFVHLIEQRSEGRPSKTQEV